LKRTREEFHYRPDVEECLIEIRLHGYGFLLAGRLRSLLQAFYQMYSVDKRSMVTDDRGGDLRRKSGSRHCVAINDVVCKKGSVEAVAGARGIDDLLQLDRGNEGRAAILRTERHAVCPVLHDDVGDPESTLVARLRHLSGLSALVPGHDRRWQRRPRRHSRRLPHIASLGVDAVWLSPFFKSPMADMGYDVSDYCDVDPMFGTLADFDALISEAHRLGLKIIIDQVLSHSSDKHPWFVESRASRDNPKADWYVWAAQARRHRSQQLAVDLRRSGLGMGFDAQAILPCTISSPRSPTSTSTIRRCRTRF
jgi:hypothetical protein